MALILRSEIGRRLTVPEIDGNFTYLENLSMGLTESRPYQSIELTYTEALALLGSGGVVDGKRYLVTGFDVELYGGTDILVSGLPNNQFSTSGYGKFYNPRYDSISVWNLNSTYSIDDLVIYGGKVWKNLTGSLGELNDIFVLDNTNWELQDDYTNIDHYFAVWDQVELGFSDNDYCINSRYDSYRNNYVRVGQLDREGNDRWFFCGVNPITAFGWGNDNINDCDIKDSYFNCLNIMGRTTIYGVKMSNYSFVFQSLFIDSAVEGLVFENESGAYTLYMTNSQFRNCIFSNNSYINGLFDNANVIHLNLSNDSSINSTIYSSTIEYLNLTNYSIITNITASASSFLSNIDLSGESYINNIDLYDSRIQYINLNNISYINSISASASYFQNINMTNQSYIENIELTVGGAGGSSTIERLDLSNRSYISNVELYNSSMYEIKFDNYSYMQGSPNIELWNYSTMNYLSLDNHSRIYGNIGLTGSSYIKIINMTNRSIIEGPIDFKNNSRIEKIDVTNDAYITNLTFNNGSYIENLDISSTYFSNIGLSASYINLVRTFASNVENIDIRNNSYLQGINIDKSNFSNLQAYNNSGIYQIDLNTTSLNLTELGTFSRTFPSGTSFRFNELKYQFDLTFNGTSGYGLTNNALNIPAMLIPYDFYIEKVIIESSTLVYSGASATFSFTMPGVLSPGTVEIAVSEMTDRIKVLDMSNGLITGIKADSDKMLMAFLTGGTNVTSGGIKMEVTLKNTRYFYD
jgi:hypothetical protein